MFCCFGSNLSVARYVLDAARSSVPAFKMSNYTHGREAGKYTHVRQPRGGSPDGCRSSRMAETGTAKPSFICWLA